MKQLSLLLHIALRFSSGARQQRFASFVSWFSTLGVTLGVASLIAVISVMNGFSQQLQSRILNVVPHFSLASAQDTPALLKDVPNSPLILSDVIIQSQQQLLAASLQGIDPKLQMDSKQLNAHLQTTNIEQLKAGKYQLILGSGLARQLDVNLGDTLRVIATDRVVYSALGELPAQRNFQVVDIFEFGSEVDQMFAITHIDDLSRMMRSSRESMQVTRYFLERPLQLESLIQQASHMGLEFDDWRRYFGEFFAAVKMERAMMSLLFGLIIAVAAFNIFSALVMIVGEKLSDIAILQTLGLSQSKIVTLFVIQGAWSGCLGALAGGVLGIGLAHSINSLLSVLGLNLSQNFAQTGLPVLVEPMQVLTIIISAMLLSIVATIYPAYKASQVLPAEALRYE
ncbi:lipoprotein-releasing ABC transporter permease subunit [Alginatibacterium sediminis]|uniref:lipoprotein-releasing ABC transporter permease subunit n=1 Tax=Alginatibacterium sediminis TaxID=2164068 RepID=UPI0013142FBA|nr:lipoprotein-releasing ABC transporter permease subunit [Alginatibacterium sediminis]